MEKWDTSIYNFPAYSVSDASRYLRIPLATLRAWLKGRFYPTKQGQQNFKPLMVESKVGIILRPSLLDPYVRVSLHTAPDILDNCPAYLIWM
jgi:hypothetical protein